MSFKVGDVVIAQNFVEMPWRNGCEGVVIAIKTNLPVVGSVTKNFAVLPLAYRVEWSDGKITAQEPYQLRLKRPPSKDDFTAGDWELCPWRPERVKG